mmetsp:Transcript_35702/g.102947  ORF Transcript_35702/g.102947 Transcript_35702/m.102947 type:complete len:687 (+) Transcript_35702:1118-3178(+)
MLPPEHRRRLVEPPHLEHGLPLGLAHQPVFVHVQASEGVQGLLPGQRLREVGHAEDEVVGRQPRVAVRVHAREGVVRRAMRAEHLPAEHAQRQRLLRGLPDLHAQAASGRGVVELPVPDGAGELGQSDVAVAVRVEAGENVHHRARVEGRLEQLGAGLHLRHRNKTVVVLVQLLESVRRRVRRLIHPLQEVLECDRALVGPHAALALVLAAPLLLNRRPLHLEVLQVRLAVEPVLLLLRFELLACMPDGLLGLEEVPQLEGAEEFRLRDFVVVVGIETLEGVHRLRVVQLFIEAPRALHELVEVNLFVAVAVDDVEGLQRRLEARLHSFYELSLGERRRELRRLVWRRGLGRGRRFRPLRRRRRRRCGRGLRGRRRGRLGLHRPEVLRVLEELSDLQRTEILDGADLAVLVGVEAVQAIQHLVRSQRRLEELVRVRIVLHGADEAVAVRVHAGVGVLRAGRGQPRPEFVDAQRLVLVALLRRRGSGVADDAGLLDGLGRLIEMPNRRRAEELVGRDPAVVVRVEALEDVLDLLWVQRRLDHPSGRLAGEVRLLQNAVAVGVQLHVDVLQGRRPDAGLEAGHGDRDPLVHRHRQSHRRRVRPVREQRMLLHPGDVRDLLQACLQLAADDLVVPVLVKDLEGEGGVLRVEAELRRSRGELLASGGPVAVLAIEGSERVLLRAVVAVDG